MKREKYYWENIYRTKQPEEVSWTQQVPRTSLEFIHGFQLPKTARIIDVGGGDSRLVDFLLDEGFEYITMLDISGAALEKARQRLGERATKVNWIEQDITEFEPVAPFDCWHDRATFHFLTNEERINKYIATAMKSIVPAGYAVIGTFSENGPAKCSGLPIIQYTEDSLTDRLHNGFQRIMCKREDHITPFNTRQNFLFCSFQRNRSLDRLNIK